MSEPHERHDDHLSTADMAGRRRTDDRDGELRGTDHREGGTRQREFAPLFASDRIHDLRSEWDEVQTGFVDEPRRAVEEADSLVAEVMQQLADQFAAEREKLEEQWDRSGDVSTEDLRVALQRYRSFFDRLLSL